MARRDQVQERASAVKQFFAEHPGQKFTLREVMSGLAENGDAELFTAHANENKRGRRTTRGNPQALLVEPASRDAGSRSRKEKSSPELKELAQLRKLKRCLEELDQEAGRTGSEGGVRLDRSRYLIRSKRRNGKTTEVVWQADGSLVRETLEREIEAFSGWMALRAVRGVLGWSMPRRVQEELGEYLEVAEEKFGELKVTSCTGRWLNALVLRPATYHYFMSQHVDLQVRGLIEDAIMLRKKVRLRLDPADDGNPFGETEKSVSISHYMLTLPDLPEILVCPHHQEMDRFGDLSGFVECLRLPLSKIRSATLLEEDAFFPPPYQERVNEELADAPGLDWQDATKQGNEVAELRVAPWLMGRWSGTWMQRNLEVIGIDLDDWFVCRIEYPRPRPKLHQWSDHGDDLFDFLSQYAAGIEVLSPRGERNRFRRRAMLEADKYVQARPGEALDDE